MLHAATIKTSGPLDLSEYKEKIAFRSKHFKCNPTFILYRLTHTQCTRGLSGPEWETLITKTLKHMEKHQLCEKQLTL